MGLSWGPSSAVASGGAALSPSLGSSHGPSVPSCSSHSPLLWWPCRLWSRRGTESRAGGLTWTASVPMLGGIQPLHATALLRLLISLFASPGTMTGSYLTSTTVHAGRAAPVAWHLPQW